MIMQPLSMGDRVSELHGVSRSFFNDASARRCWSWSALRPSYCSPQRLFWAAGHSLKPFKFWIYGSCLCQVHWKSVFWLMSCLPTVRAQHLAHPALRLRVDLTAPTRVAAFLSVVRMVKVALDDSSITTLMRPLTHCNRSIRELNVAGSLDAVTALGCTALAQMLLTNDALQRVYLDSCSTVLVEGVAAACSKYRESAPHALPRVSAALHFETPPVGGMLCLPVVDDATAAAVAVLLSCAASLVGMYCNVSLVPASSTGFAWLLRQPSFSAFL